MKFTNILRPLSGLLAVQVTSAFTCSTDDDCSLNGICSTSTGTCQCDSGWKSDDCGKLDLQPVTRWTGYNHTNVTDGSYYSTKGNSSWGGQILQDRHDKGLFHLVISQFARGCGLAGWRPFSKVIRAESRTGPAGPYFWAQDILPTFRHNPTTIWSPADNKYLLYSIGIDAETPDTCKSFKWANNISVASAPDIRGPWSKPVRLINGTNPTPWPLYNRCNRTPEILLGVEDGFIHKAASAEGPYSLINTMPWNTSDYAPTWSEDPFLWRDRRGNWHMLVHWMIDISERGEKFPRVGGHMYSRKVDSGWQFKQQEVYNTTVLFTDGGRTDYYRRERPKLFFSDDGKMTPLFLTNGVQEFESAGTSYTLIQPIGDAASRNYRS